MVLQGTFSMKLLTTWRPPTAIFKMNKIPIFLGNRYGQKKVKLKNGIPIFKEFIFPFVE